MTADHSRAIKHLNNVLDSLLIREEITKAEIEGAKKSIDESKIRLDGITKERNAIQESIDFFTGIQ